MIKIDIPGSRTIEAEHLVLDFNGTIAIDGRFIDGVLGLLVQVSANLKVHVLTADTFGTVQNELKGLPVCIKTIEPGQQIQQKLDYVNSLGSSHVICTSINYALSLLINPKRLIATLRN